MRASRSNSHHLETPSKNLRKLKGGRFIHQVRKLRMVIHSYRSDVHVYDAPHRGPQFGQDFTVRSCAASRGYSTNTVHLSLASTALLKFSPRPFRATPTDRVSTKNMTR